MCLVNDKNNLLKEDFRRIGILASISLVIGTYLILDTTMISKDGVLYIERAMRFGSNPLEVIKGDPPFGFSFLIFCGYQLIKLFISGDTTHVWQVSGQVVTLILKTVAVTPLYFFGKWIVGANKSFWGVLVILFLPYPAEIGSDVLRDWPHLLFLFTGICFLYLGFKESKWWLFILAGLTAGAACTIRVEGTQIVIYGLVWIGCSMVFKWQPEKKMRLLLWGGLLVISFFIATLPYLYANNWGMTAKIKTFLHVAHNKPMVEREIRLVQQASINSRNLASSGFLGGGIAILDRLSKNMMYYFFPFCALGVGNYVRRYDKRRIENFLILSIFLFYIAILLMLYKNCNYMSSRHVLVLVAILLWFAADGFEAIGLWLNRNKDSVTKRNGEAKKLRYILMIIGIGICLPKLFSLTKEHKQYYMDTAMWIKNYTPKDTEIATFDRRIGFYSERKYFQYDDRNRTFDTTKFKGYLVSYDGVEVGRLKPVKVFKDARRKKDILIYIVK